MNWTPVTSFGPRAAHTSRMPVQSEARESTDLSRSCRVGSGLVGKDSSPGSRPSLFSPQDSPKSSLQQLRASFEQRSSRCESPLPRVEMGLFCTILVQSFRCNTSKLPPMCCKQRTCATPKSFRCNIYKKHRGWGQTSLSSFIFNPYFLTSLPPYFHSRFSEAHNRA